MLSRNTHTERLIIDDVDLFPLFPRASAGSRSGRQPGPTPHFVFSFQRPARPGKCHWTRRPPTKPPNLTSAENRRFPEITGEDNLTVFSSSGGVKSPEWRWQRRRADLRHFEIFRHGPIIIYTRLPAGGTYCPICTFPASSECLISISDAFSAFVYGYPSSSPRAHCTPNKSVSTLRYTRWHGQVHARRLLTSAVPWISEDRLLAGGLPKMGRIK